MVCVFLTLDLVQVDGEGNALCYSQSKQASLGKKNIQDVTAKKILFLVPQSTSAVIEFSKLLIITWLQGVDES